MSDRAKIKNRRVAGNTLQQQREVANAVKVAREMALLPYAKRVASTRTGGRGRDGGREGGRGRDESVNDNVNDTETDELTDQVEGIDVATDEVEEGE
jgi:small subunit ribosomal protein S18